MPPKGWKTQKYEKSLLEATEWKRQFFETTDFDSLQALVEAAAWGGSATPYVEAFLALGHRPERRHNCTELLLGLQEHPPPKWVARVASALWLVYNTEKNTWKAQDRDEPTELALSTRRQRTLFRGTGLVNKRRKSLKGRAAAARLEAVNLIQSSTYVQWVDNFNKMRFSRNPNEERNACINATVFAVLPMPAVPVLTWGRWPSVQQLVDAIGGLPRAMVQHHKEQADRIRELMHLGLRHPQVRVPCDLRRYGVTSLPWRPLGIEDADIKDTKGLVEALLQVIKM